METFQWPVLRTKWPDLHMPMREPSLLWAIDAGSLILNVSSKKANWRENHWCKEPHVYISVTSQDITGERPVPDRIFSYYYHAAHMVHSLAVHHFSSHWFYFAYFERVLFLGFVRHIHFENNFWKTAVRRWIYRYRLLRTGGGIHSHPWWLLRI